MCQCLTSVREIEEGGDLGTDTTSPLPPPPPPHLFVDIEPVSLVKAGVVPVAGPECVLALLSITQGHASAGRGRRERHLVRLLIMNSLIRLELQPPPLQHNCIHFLIWINQVLSIE